MGRSSNQCRRKQWLCEGFKKRRLNLSEIEERPGKKGLKTVCFILKVAVDSGYGWLFPLLTESFLGSMNQGCRIIRNEQIETVANMPL